MRSLKYEPKLAARRPLHWGSTGIRPQLRTDGLWVLSPSTARLLKGLSTRLELGWQLNGVSRPKVLALTNLGGADPAGIAARCRPDCVVLCLDDKAGRDFVDRAQIPCFTYSEGRDEADLTARDLRSTSDGLSFLAVTRDQLAQVVVPEEELYSALTALACATMLGIPLSCAAREVSELLCGHCPPRLAGA